MSNLFSGENEKKNISECHLLKFLTRLQSVKTIVAKTGKIEGNHFPLISEDQLRSFPLNSKYNRIQLCIE